jgi:hypothetical protein
MRDCFSMCGFLYADITNDDALSRYWNAWRTTAQSRLSIRRTKSVSLMESTVAAVFGGSQ